MKVEIHIDCSDGLTFKRPSLAKSQFADECDLGKIISRFMRTGELPNLQVKKPLNIDITDTPTDFQELQEWKVNLSNQFEAEPLAIRELFQHSLEQYCEFKCLTEEEQEAFIKSKTQSAAQPAAQSAAQPAAQPAEDSNVQNSTTMA